MLFRGSEVLLWGSEVLLWGDEVMVRRHEMVVRRDEIGIDGRLVLAQIVIQLIVCFEGSGTHVGRSFQQSPFIWGGSQLLYFFLCGELACADEQILEGDVLAHVLLILIYIVTHRMNPKWTHRQKSASLASLTSLTSRILTSRMDSLPKKSHDDELSHLRRNLETAVQSAIQSRLVCVKSKDELLTTQYSKATLENKVKSLLMQIEQQGKSMLGMETCIAGLKESQCALEEKYVIQSSNLAAKCQEIEKLAGQRKIIERLELSLTSLPPLKERVIELEREVREAKQETKKSQERNSLLTAEKELLKKQLATAKPREQELQDKIAYCERVNLDLERKMEDFNRRENEYIKQIAHQKLLLKSAETEGDKFRGLYEDTRTKLRVKTQEHLLASQEVEVSRQLTVELRGALAGKEGELEACCLELRQKVEFYREQGMENNRLAVKNRALLDQELEMKGIIENHLRVAGEINLQIVKKAETIWKLKRVRDQIDAQLRTCEDKFAKFDRLDEEGSVKSQTQLREGMYQHVRENNRLTLQLKEEQFEFNEKLLLMGEERDQLQRRIQIYQQLQLTSKGDSTMHLSMLSEKSTGILLLQSSNDQLLKLKRDNEEHITELNRLLQQEKKEAFTLRLKAADLFKTKKELQECRKTLQRYQDMIEEQKESINDLHSQMQVLRSKVAVCSDKNFMLDQTNKQLSIRIQEQQFTMKELDVGLLQERKNANEKNTHLLSDALEKCQSGLKSLSYYFSCCFCGQIPVSTVTLALCGHNYCAKCKEAYDESCYECDNGLPVERTFPNRYLKQATSKYKFLLMILSELHNNFQKG